MKQKTFELPIENLRSVNTFHGTDYYLDLVFPSGKKKSIGIYEIDYINLTEK